MELSLRALLNKKYRAYLLAISLVLVSVVSFQNCAPNFPAVDERGSVGFSSVMDQKVDLNLMSANQVLESLMAATQMQFLSDAQREEYNLRRNSFSDLGDTGSINAPYLLSLTSLSGPFCDELVNRERLISDGARRYYNGISFIHNPSFISDERFIEIAELMAREIWRTPLSEQEKFALREFKSGFLEGITNPTADQTRSLMVSLCVAILANVNLVVY